MSELGGCDVHMLLQRLVCGRRLMCCTHCDVCSKSRHDRLPVIVNTFCIGPVIITTVMLAMVLIISKVVDTV